MAIVKGTGKRRLKVLRYARSHPPTQWQGGTAFFGGTTGCSATSVQFILALHGIRVGLDDIAKAVGYPDAIQARYKIGLYDHQVVEALAHWGVRYKFTTEHTARELIRLAARNGTYGYWPQRRGHYSYLGEVPDGKPNGYAKAEGGGGKDQLRGFEHGRHMGLLLSKRHRSGTPYRATKVFLWDPNHGSKVRPHIPDYDVVTPHQWEALYLSARLTSKNGKPMALVPLEAL